VDGIVSVEPDTRIPSFITGSVVITSYEFYRILLTVDYFPKPAATELLET